MDRISSANPRGSDAVASDGMSKKAFCFEDLQRRILTQDLDPGLDLDEVDLAKTYDISRPPVREVLNQLAGEGYVVLRKNRGAQVAPMSHKTLRNFFLAAPMLYAAVAKLAAQNATEAQIMRLKDAQTLFRKAIREGKTSDRALTNQRFHAVIGDMADNEFLTPSYRRLLIDHTRIGMSFYDPLNRALWKRRSLAADQHDQFISMIEQRNDEACGQLAIDHWELSRAEIESFASPAGMQFPLGEAPDALKGMRV